MRLRHPDGRFVHLGYEVTPRPYRRVSDMAAQLDTFAAARTMIGVDALGVSLWLPPTMAAALTTGARIRARLRTELEARRLEVVTLSGLSFHARTDPSDAETDRTDEPERDTTNEPDNAGEPDDTGEPAWDDPARREYTLDLARTLVDLLPADTVRGAVGTIGLARHDHWGEETAKAGAGVLRRLSGGLADIAWQTGRAVRVGFQTADGYVVDSPDATVAALARIDKDRLGVRLDLDHVTRTWDDPARGVRKITDAGLSIIEVRLTAAPGPRLDAWRAALGALLGAAGPLTEYVTLAPQSAVESADQVASDLAYLQAELAVLGLAPENEPCAAR